MSIGTGPGIDRDAVRAGGKRAADVVADEQAEDMDAAMDEEVLDIERELTFQSAALSRMRTEWTGESRIAMDRIDSAIRDVMVDTFMDAYVLIEELYGLVREPAVDPETGETLTDKYGFTEWVKSDVGVYVEDWTRLTSKEREHYLLRLTTHLFEWEQKAADLWTQAMFSKAVWTESFATHFNDAVRGTVDHRTARGNMRSAEDRYFALYLSALSRKSDALVRSMERLTLRLRDSMGA